MSQTPPPLPPQRPPIVEYHHPSHDPPRSFRLDTGGADGFTGINLRLMDNVSQLLAGVVGAVIGGMGGLIYATHSTRWTNVIFAMFFGAVAGLLAGVFACGIFLGIYHLVRRRRQ